MGKRKILTIKYIILASIFISLLVSLCLQRNDLYLVVTLFVCFSLMLSLFLIFLAKETVKIPKIYLLIIILVYWLWLFFNLCISSVFSLSLYAFVFQSVLPLLFFILLLTSIIEEYWFFIYCCLIGILILLVIYALFQYYSLQQAPAAFFPNKNLFAAIINLLLWPTCAYFLLYRSKVRVLSAILIFLLTYSLALNASRGAELAFVAAFILFFSISWQKTKTSANLILLSILIIAFISAAMQSIGFTSAEAVNTSGNARLIIWQQVWQMIKIAPILGHGLGSFASMYPIYRSPLDTSAGYFAHNDYLQLWDETGIVGLLLFLSILISFIVIYIKVALKKNKEVRQFIEITGLFCALLTVVIHSFFTYSFHIVSILIILSFIAARFVFLAYQFLKVPNYYFNIQIIIRPVLYWIFVSIVTVLLFASSALLMTGELLTFHAQQDWQRHKIESALQKLNLAQLLWPFSSKNYNLALKINLQLLNVTPKISSALRKMIYQESIVQFNLSRRLNSYQPLLFLYRGLLAEMNPNATEQKNSEQAIRAYRHGLYLNRRFYPLRIVYAKLLLKHGKLSEANQLLIAGLRLPYLPRPGLLKYFELLRDVQKELNNKAGVTYLNEMIKMNRKWIHQASKKQFTSASLPVSSG